MILPLTGIMVLVETPTGNGVGTTVAMPALALVMEEVKNEDDATSSVNITAIVVITPEHVLSLISHTPALKFGLTAGISGQNAPPAPVMVPPDLFKGRLP